MKTIINQSYQSKRIRAGQPFSGEVTIRNLDHKVSRINNHYILFEVKPDLLPVKVFAMEDAFKGIDKFWHGQSLYIEGYWKKFGDELQIQCKSINLTNKQNDEVNTAKENIRTLFDNLSDPLLKKFISRVLKDQSIINDFETAPASLNHHHAYEGGLLVHSSEVAWNIFNLPNLDERERQIVAVAGLFHDLGKIRTLSGNMSRTKTGNLIRHEDLTLEILSPHLQWLERKNSQLSIYLRYMLVWNKKTYGPLPKLDLIEILNMFDRLSASAFSH